MKAWHLMVAACGMVVLGGCAQIPMGAPVPSVENIQKAKAAGIAPLAVGRFVLADGLPASIDQRVTIRTHTIYSPRGGSFANYLAAVLSTDLEAAGLRDDASRAVIEGALLDNQLDVPVGASRGLVAVRFVVKKGGTKVYEKEFRSSATWESSFVGVEALPAGVNQYFLLYRKLIGMLLDDHDFRVAASR